tara:strand:- start:380 stop:493 length:114 start_codon:yes stop_codon:yes gene_type:complete
MSLVKDVDCPECGKPACVHHMICHWCKYQLTAKDVIE